MKLLSVFSAVLTLFSSFQLVFTQQCETLTIGSELHLNVQGETDVLAHTSASDTTIIKKTKDATDCSQFGKLRQTTMD